MSDFTRYAANVNVAGTTSPLTAKANTIVAGPCRLYGIYINTALSAHTQLVQDYDTGSPLTATTVATIPASAAAGTMFSFPGIEFHHTLRILSNNAAATGVLTVVYKSGTASSLGIQGV